MAPNLSSPFVAQINNALAFGWIISRVRKEMKRQCGCGGGSVSSRVAASTLPVSSPIRVWR